MSSEVSSWYSACVLVLVALIAALFPAGAVAQDVTDIFGAAAAGDAGAVSRHLSSGVDPNTRDAQGRTPLMHAAAGGHREVVELLLSSGADAQYRDAALWSAGMYAREHGHPEITAHLGANPTLRGVMNAPNVRLREGPGLDTAVIRMLAEGEGVTILENTPQKHRVGDLYDHWYRLRTADGRIGWAFGEYIDVEPGDLGSAAILDVLAWRVWTRLTRLDGRWVIYEPCFAGVPTIEVWLTEEGEARLTHFEGQAAWLYHITRISDWGDQVILDMQSEYGGVDAVDALVVATLFPGPPGSGMVGWNMPPPGSETGWYVPEESLDPYEVVSEEGCEAGP